MIESIEYCQQHRDMLHALVREMADDVKPETVGDTEEVEVPA
jgi:hypothetical protein